MSKVATSRAAVWAACGIAAVALSSLVYLVAGAMHAVDETLCHANLYKLRHALVQYDSVNGSLPPAATPNAEGDAAHSWRVLILPYLDAWGIDGEAIYGAYDMAAPWNAQANRRLFQPVAESRFACPCGSEEGTTRTSYVVLVGNSTLFPPDVTVSVSQVPNSIDPILVVEITNSDIEWAEPRDLPVGDLGTPESKNSIALAKPHAGAIRYITLGGNLGVLPKGTTLDELRTLAGIDGSASEELP